MKKFTFPFFVIILSFFFLFTSCQQKDNSLKNNKPKSSITKKKNSKQTKIANVKKQKANLKSKVGLSDEKVNAVFAINQKYDLRIKKQKEGKKWDGPANADNRRKHNAAKAKELKKVLGKKYKPYTQYLAKKKKGNKKKK